MQELVFLLMQTAETYWRKLCNSLSISDELCNTEWQNIYKAYSGKSRHYHNLLHIENMLGWLEKYNENPLPAKDVQALQLAIFFHDIVYSATKKDNEEKNADAALRFMQKAALSPAMQALVNDLIMATKSHMESANPLVGLMTDLDLQILGAEENVYRKYSADIRKEYRVYPNLLYKPGRKKVLQHFIAMPRIYQTDFFYKQFEKKAKQNLQNEQDSNS